MSMWRKAPDVRAIAEDLIASVPEHEALIYARMEYLFIDKAPKSRGRLVLGRARRVGGLNSVLANLTKYESEVCQDPIPFFVIEISEDTWRGLDDAGRRALVDHELCHCRIELDEALDDYVLSTRPHDLEEFAGIIRRHGLWYSAAEEMGSAVMEQLALAIDSVETFVNGLAVDPNTGEFKDESRPDDQ